MGFSVSVRRASWLTALLLVAALPSATAQSPNSKAVEFREKWGLSTSQSLINQLADDPSANREYGVPLRDSEVEELVERGKISPQLDGLHAYIADHGNRFGGLYIDNPAGGVVVIQVTPAATDANREAAAAAVPNWIETRFEEVENSINQLDEAHEQLDDLLREDTPEVEAITGIDHMLGENVLRIRVLPESLDSVRSFVRELVGQELVRFEVGGYDQPSACTDRQNCWQDPLRGGITVYKTVNSPCTIGYMVYNTDGGRRLLTAGHCLASSGTRYHDGNSVGGVSKSSWFDNSTSDFGILYGGDNLNGSPDWSGHIIYRTNSDKAQVMETQAGPTTLGESVNMAGQTSGIEYGQVVSLGHTSNWGGGFKLYHMMVGDFENAPGDSGAPVFYGSIAKGVQSGCVSDPGEACTGDSSQDSVFSDIDRLWAAKDGSTTGDPFEMKVCLYGDAETSC